MLLAVICYCQLVVILTLIAELAAAKESAKLSRQRFKYQKPVKYTGPPKEAPQQPKTKPLPTKPLSGGSIQWEVQHKSTRLVEDSLK